MPIFVDARIPVVFADAASAGPDDAVLVAGDDWKGPLKGPGLAAGISAVRFHAAGCTCCVPRGAVVDALSRLFLARARGEAPLFRRVVVSAGPEARSAVCAALGADAFLSGRYRLAS